MAAALPVASQYPPISLFEDYVDPELTKAALLVESRTNPRLHNEPGDISLVPKSEALLGPGASPVMAAFTDVGRESRFGDGSFGIYYAADSIETALSEVRFHRECFLRHTHPPPLRLTQRTYVGRLEAALHDIRGGSYARYRNPAIGTYPPCQRFSIHLRATGSAGLVYGSARRSQDECVAFYRPRAVGIPVQGKRYVLVWDGRRISECYELKHVSASKKRTKRPRDPS